MLTASASPYEAVLGDAFARLDPHVQRAHRAPLIATGSLDVEHGSHPLTPLLVRLLKLPARGYAQRVRLEVGEEAGGAIVWRRQVGRSVLRTIQHAHQGRIVERSGLGRIGFDLHVRDGSLEYQQVMMTLARVPVPACIRPHVCARVSAAPQGWHVTVVVTWRSSFVCRYAGVMHAI
jgi:hypothetical protein